MKYSHESERKLNPHWEPRARIMGARVKKALAKRLGETVSVEIEALSQYDLATQLPKESK